MFYWSSALYIVKCYHNNSWSAVNLKNWLIASIIQGKRPYSFVRIVIAVIFYYLKGLGHAILGNLTIDHVVID